MSFLALRSGGFLRYGTVMNIFTAPINIIKSYSLAAPAGFRTADGYPNGTLPSTVQSQGGPPDAPYYDKHVMKWNGQATLASVGTCAIIYSATAGITVSGIASSCVFSNLQFSSTNTTGHRVVFKHGTLVTGVSGGNGSPVVLNTVNQPFNIVAGQKIKIGVGVSANLANGPNSDGTWTVASVGGSQSASPGTITLANSSGVISPTVTGAGGPDVQTEAVLAIPGLAWSFPSGSTYVNFNSLVWVKIANEAAEAAGKTVDPDYVAQLKQLGVRWLRTMDSTGVQGNWETSWAARRLPSYISWVDKPINANYYVGAIANGGSDNFTCSAPSLTSTGAYKHGEIVIGTIGTSNAGNFPTLNVAGRGAKPVTDDSCLWKMKFNAAASASNQTLSIAFSSAWFTYTFNYVTRDTMTITGAADNGSGKVRLTVNSTAGWVTGQGALITGVAGTTEVNNIYGTQAVTIVDATHVDVLGVNFVNAYVSGGTAAPKFGSDLQSTGGIPNVQANFADQFNLNSTVNGKITARNSGVFAIYFLTQQQGALSITYSGPVSTTPYSMPILDGNNNPRMAGTKTFIYDYILDCWLMRDGGLVQSTPFEYIAELANSVGGDVWHNWPILTTANMVTNTTAFFRDNLNPGLRFGTEIGNELWNFSQEPWGYALSFGYALGMSNAGHYDNGASYSYCALRCRQFADLAIAAWTTTRPRKDLYILVMSAEWDQASTDQYFLGCQELGNSIALAYGGLDGAAGSTNAATNYSVAGQRVGENFDAWGIAPYWGSDFLNGDVLDARYGTLQGTQAQNVPLLAASAKYAAGNLTGGSGCYDDMYAWFYAAVSLGGPAGGLNLLRNYKNRDFPQAEAICRKWDPYRIAAQGRPVAVLHYEAGPQFGLGNINNGTNSPTIDIAAVCQNLVGKVVGSGWDLSAYTSQGTVAITGATYSQFGAPGGFGLLTLTLASPVTLATAAAIHNMAGTGAVANLNGGWNLVSPVVNSATVQLITGGGLTLTVTGGTLYLNVVDVATNICGMVYNFKFSQQFYRLNYNYMKDVTTVHSGREACASQYGYSSGQWGLFPISWTRGVSTAYSSFQAIADFNAGL